MRNRLNIFAKPVFCVTPLILFFKSIRSEIIYFPFNTSQKVDLSSSQGYNVRKVICSCLYSAYILKPGNGWNL